MKRPIYVQDAISIDSNGLFYGSYADFSLYSAYQPIYELSKTGATTLFAFEGLIRPRAAGLSIDPDRFFASIDPKDQLFVECMCQALHVRNYQHANPGHQTLFVNSNPASYSSLESLDREFNFLISRFSTYGLTPSTIVIELLETVPYSQIILDGLREITKSNGILFALDDFGVGESQLDRYQTLKPDLVKLDKQYFANGCCSAPTRQLIKSQVSRFHDDGARVVVEGIESEEQLGWALEIGADFVQGFLLHSPELLPSSFSINSSPALNLPARDFAASY